MMNESEREVLKKHHIDLVQDITVTEELLGICYQHKLFDNYMVDTIRSQIGDYQKAAKLLEFLPKRGPGAFEKFLKVLQSGHPWLADMLRSSLKEVEMERKSNTSYLPKLEVNGNILVNSPRVPSAYEKSPEQTDPKIKGLVNKFMNKQFKLNRSLSYTDKQAVEQFLTEQLEKVPRESLDEVDNYFPTDKNSALSKQWLHNLYIKLKVRIDALECPRKNGNTGEIDNKIYTVETVNTSVLEKQVNFVLDQLETLDAQMSHCYNMMKDSNCRRSLSLQFEELLLKCEELSEEVEKGKQKVEEISRELEHMSMEKKKAEHNIQLKDIQLELKENQIHKMEHDNSHLKHEVDKLNHLHQQHLEKQKTLHSLREMLNELQDSETKSQTKNKNLKTRLSTAEKEKPGTRLSTKTNSARTVTAKSNKTKTTCTQKIPSTNNLTFKK